MLIHKIATVFPLHNNCASSIAYYCKDDQSAPTLYPNILFLWGPEFRRCTDKSHLIRKIILKWPEMIFTVGTCQISLWNPSKINMNAPYVQAHNAYQTQTSLLKVVHNVVKCRARKMDWENTERTYLVIHGTAPLHTLLHIHST